jgi:hypothetical protein
MRLLRPLTAPLLALALIASLAYVSPAAHAQTTTEDQSSSQEERFGKDFGDEQPPRSDDSGRAANTPRATAARQVAPASPPAAPLPSTGLQIVVLFLLGGIAVSLGVALRPAARTR